MPVTAFLPLPNVLPNAMTGFGGGGGGGGGVGLPAWASPTRIKPIASAATSGRMMCLAFMVFLLVLSSCQGSPDRASHPDPACGCRPTVHRGSDSIRGARDGL